MTENAIRNINESFQLTNIQDALNRLNENKSAYESIFKKIKSLKNSAPPKDEDK